jgi:hypothetical protein
MEGAVPTWWIGTVRELLVIDSTSMRPRPAGTYADPVRQRWFSRRAWFLHVGVTLIVLGCLAAAWWQGSRALGGHTLSWFYTVEWPGFAVFAIAGWWHLIHEDPEVRRARKQGTNEWEELEDPYRTSA